tara:strand:+ start:54007 stop:54639 length:633 start_codon:yes stop_codon:yes gene_type:complete
MSIRENFIKIKNSLPNNVTLVAVSKKQSISSIYEVYSCGHKIFGENNAIELAKKAETMPSDIKWHMIGHLQRKKVKYIIKHVDLIHSIDSIKLLDEINKRAMKINKVIKCLVQIKIAKESNKFGIDKNEINELINDSKKFTNIKIIGLMGMATNTNDASVINSEFSFLSNIFETIKNNDIKILSMGMSGDFSYAIKNNANMVRIGSSIFN